MSLNATFSRKFGDASKLHMASCVALEWLENATTSPYVSIRAGSGGFLFSALFAVLPSHPTQSATRCAGSSHLAAWLLELLFARPRSDETCNQFPGNHVAIGCVASINAEFGAALLELERSSPSRHVHWSSVHFANTRWFTRHAGALRYRSTHLKTPAIVARDTAVQNGAQGEPSLSSCPFSCISSHCQSPHPTHFVPPLAPTRLTRPATTVRPISHHHLRSWIFGLPEYSMHTTNTVGSGKLQGLKCGSGIGTPHQPNAALLCAECTPV